MDILPAIADPAAPTRDYALCGMFGMSVSITDGRWILHQSPVADNQPLFWHGYHLARFINYDLGPYQNGRRPVHNCPSWDTPTWLSDKGSDVNELENLAAAAELQRTTRQFLHGLGDHRQGEFKVRDESELAEAVAILMLMHAHLHINANA